MMVPDLEQRAQALDPTESYIVQSPAGSGKTELLIQRYLTLLGIARKPEAVLAITFTRKAAGEMRRRVMNALTNASRECPARPHEALTWNLARKVRGKSETHGWRLMENPVRLRIQTFDSLCASFVRQTPWLSQLGAPPEIVDDAEELYRESARSTIELIEDDRWSSEIGALLSHVDNNFQVLENLIIGMLARRDQWLRHIASTDPDNGRAALERALDHAVEDAVATVRKAIPERLAAEIASITAEAGRNLSATGREGPARAGIDLTNLPGADRLDAWLGIAHTLLTGKDSWRKKLTVAEGFPADDKPLKHRCGELIAGLAEMEDVRIALSELRHLPYRKFTKSQWKVLMSMVKILPAAVEKLKDIFRSRGVADYVEVAIAARKSLGVSDAAADPLAGTDHPFDHILIDEFQDTSVSQYSLLAALTAGWKTGDGKTVFAVGDPMQSIYRFREAEVGLFLKTCLDGIGSISMNLLRLSSNFRSEKGIVDWVNGAFAGVMPSVENITTGAIPFSASDSVHGPGSVPAVAFHPLIGRDDEREAAQVLDIIRSARDRQKEVAILVRARTHLTSILPALREADLKFQAVDIEPLAQVPVVQDLTALVRALMHPADRIAWLALLRAPWCGMTLEELHILAGDDHKATIRDLLRDESRIQLLDTDGRKRLIRVRSVIETALEKRPVSLRSWIEGVWFSLGGPACAANATEIENAGVVFDLLEEMDDGGMLDIALFDQRIQGLYARPDSEADSSLQIMSIHKAKGLEFDVVIVPGLGRKPKADESRLMLWLERPRLNEETDLLLAPIHATGADDDKTYNYLKRVDSFKSEYESGRLLYVAATRARSELHLLGHTEHRIKDEALELKDPASGSLLKRLWAVAGPQFQKALSAPPSLNGIESSGDKRTPQAIERLSPDWNLPELPATVEGAERSAAGEVEENAVSFHWVGDTLRHIGTVIHQTLKQIADDGIHRWDEDKIQKNRGSCLSALASLGVPAGELQRAVDRVAAALSHAIKDERGKWILGAHDNAACEYSICGVLEGRIISARMDRTFIDDRNVRWIIDYKSSIHEGAGIEAFLDNECARYRGQLKQYRLLFGLMESRQIRTALYFPLLNAWREVE